MKEVGIQTYEKGIFTQIISLENLERVLYSASTGACAGVHFVAKDSHSRF